MGIVFTNSKLKILSTHFIGNKYKDEKPFFSKKQVDISNPILNETLLNFLTSSFRNSEEYYNFHHESDLTLNSVYHYVGKIFSAKRDFHNHSINIAKQFYEAINSPNIKSGEIHIVYFDDILINDILTDAVGIYKTSAEASYLKFNKNSENYFIDLEKGISTDKFDKGCIIFNVNKQAGYQICVIDNTNKNDEALYWNNIFLKIHPIGDNYFFTKKILSITKEFVVNQYPNDFEVSKSDQIDILNRSMQYFKSHDIFNKKDFEKEVLIENEIIKSFRKYDKINQEGNESLISENFEISKSAFKKQTKNFKSILKLDKNFHIYIHGNSELIEQGIDKDGRKFYKIYYEEER